MIPRVQDIPPQKQELAPVPLPVSFKTNGLYLKQVKRTDKKAMYSVHLSDPGMIIGYEVWKIEIAPETEVFGRKYPLREKKPSNEDFGDCAWAWNTLEMAEKCYNSMKQENQP